MLGIMSSRGGRGTWVAAATWALALVVACAPVRLVEDYDSYIDQGLTSYYEEVISFTTRMAQLAAVNAPEAQYANPDTQLWYADTDAKVDALVLRAQADEVSTCLPTGVGAEAVDEALALAESQTALAPGPEATSDAGATASDEAGLVGQGSCTVVILRMVRANQALLEDIHEADGVLTAFTVERVQPLIGQGVRIALANELAKRRE